MNIEDNPELLFVGAYVLPVIALVGMGLFRRGSGLIVVLNSLLAASSALMAGYVLLAAHHVCPALDPWTVAECHAELRRYGVVLSTLALLSGVAAWRGRR